MRVETPDFVFCGMLEQERPETGIPVSELKPRKPAEVARAAAALCWRIRHECPDPTTWRARIDAADPELRECLREYLKQAYREMQQRARRETVGKRCEAGDAAMAALKQRYGGV